MWTLWLVFDITRIRGRRIQMKLLQILCVGFLITPLMLGCSGADSEIKVAHILSDISIAEFPEGIVPLPDNVPSAVRNLFDRYTRITAPNGKAIHMLAQAGWANDQILKARNVLEFLLTNYPGSAYGNDKTAVANTMADRNATMVLFNTPQELRAAFRTPLRDVDLSMQDLRANECPAEGTEDYMNHVTRDASFEEIWHLVHDNGVKQVLPDMIAEMRVANDAAAEKGWRAWPEDEPDEHPNEYVGVLIDNYYDLWTVRPKKYEGRDIGPEDVPEGTSHFGRYFANSREKLKTLDPSGYALTQKFFHPYLTYNTHLPEDFNGTFSISFDKNKVYTYKSQHLNDVTLTGQNNANLVGNGLDNQLTGNAGDNRLTGKSGNDVLDGGEGVDTAVFSGRYRDYRVSKVNGNVTVQDKKNDRDGQDILKNIEKLQFKDRSMNTEAL